MYTTKAVIQRIDLATKSVVLQQNFNLQGGWSFNARDTSASERPDPATFPFEFFGGERFITGHAGNETKLRFAADGRLLFADDYGVPEGFLIGIVFPPHYSPDVFKFNTKPSIPTGTGFGRASVQPPGHFQVLVNRSARICAVAFHITHASFFGFKCIASRKSDDEFPKAEDSPFHSDLHATMGFGESHPIAVSVDEVRRFERQFKPGTDLDDVAQNMNRLLALVEAERTEDAAEAQSILVKLQQALGNVASVVQLLDSYYGGSVGKLVTWLGLQ